MNRRDVCKTGRYRQESPTTHNCTGKLLEDGMVVKFVNAFSIL